MRVPLEWLKEFVEIRMKPERLAFTLTMAGLEVEAVERVGEEVIFEIAVTPNRGDCLSIQGIAREVAAITSAQMKPPRTPPRRGKGTLSRRVCVRIRHPQRCPRYSARIVEGVRTGPSPAHVVKRLAAAGIRSINNVVDAANYVMLETGQPLHAFDLSTLRGGEITVRTAGRAQEFSTLDGVRRRLDPEDLLICDAEGPVAIAGVMGGQDSDVRRETTALLLESACFEPRGIRRTSRRLGLASESSRRFERGVDPFGTRAALDRLTELILANAGGLPAAEPVDLFPGKAPSRRVAIHPDEVRRILGMNVAPARIAAILSSLGCALRRRPGGKGLVATVPSWRTDLERPIDLIEEIARIHGYGEIAETMPVVAMAPIARPRFFEEERRVRDALAGAGLSEALLYGFTGEAWLSPFAELGVHPVRVENPLSQEQALMRTTLLPGLLEAVRLGASRQRLDCRLYALQRIYRRPMAIGPSEEPRHLAGVLSGASAPGSWERAKAQTDFYDAKGVVENILDTLGLAPTAIFQRGEGYRFLHPGAFAYVIIGGRRVGFVGQLHPEVQKVFDLKAPVFLFELDFEELAHQGASGVIRFSELSRFPFVERDLALVVRERIPAVEVEEAILQSGEELVAGVRIFDLYRGEGLPPECKSLGITLRFSSASRTLTEEEVEGAQGRIVARLTERLGAELRS